MPILEIISKSRNKLDSFSDLIPVFSFIGITLTLVNTVLFNEMPLGSETQHAYADFWIKHFFDTPALFILLMYAKSKTYKWPSWLCLACISVLWLINTVFVAFQYPRDIYFAVYCSGVYLFFVIFVTIKICQRNQFDVKN